MTRPEISRPAGAAPEGCNGQELLIVQLLYSGLDDAAIGRRLGMSQRTVQRRVHTLMLRLEAPGRVALGAKAQQLGWLEPPRARPRPSGTLRVPAAPCAPRQQSASAPRAAGLTSPR
ncbi:LuxR C-terminal-related transcriptional regulator [Streptomyces sp. NPDC050658]|uniref:LuxR C-terminal-related transcriptional regulator n=1 Tax=unclassified Streptomyces TaxID=2593676 RepID=UPI00343EC8A0